jgi:hypothetical protein
MAHQIQLRSRRTALHERWPGIDDGFLSYIGETELADELDGAIKSAVRYASM